MGAGLVAAAVSLGLTSLWALYSSYALMRNYMKARSMGLPIRIIPIGHLNLFWMLIDTRVLSVVKRFPFGLGDNNFTRYNWRGWELKDRYRSHHEIGPAFVIVTPERNWLYLSNPDTINEVMRRSGDFSRCVKLMEMLDIFGPNISTAEGRQWKTQRKATASCFNESTNRIVWREAIWLAKDMASYWMSKQSTNSVADDCRTLSLHVLTRAIFDKSFKFEGRDDPKANISLLSYKASLRMILENCLLIMAFGTKTLAHPLLPKKFHKVHEACNCFQGYMTKLYEEGKKSFAEGKNSGLGKNLITSLIHASQSGAKTGGELTEAEIYGNIFALNFAGHDTTSHTFNFALYFLAASPDVQAWIHEEILEVLGEDDQDWDYKRDFPRLTRCLAILMETIRLYTPVPVTKWTDQQSQTLMINEKPVVIPPRMMIIPSYAAVHTDPEYWGNDSLEWRPSRWISPDTVASGAGAEQVITPRKGTFLGWSEGPRDCIGRKFSQVEFVATLARIFRHSRVDPVLEVGENMSQARSRVKKEIETDSGMVLLLQMLHPERTSLKWTQWAAESG